jgi:phosphomannomutase
MMHGKSFYGEQIQALGRVAGAGDYAEGAGTVADVAVREDYVARLLADYSGGTALKVAWDPGNGAAGDVVRALSERLPGTHILINDAIDGTFPAHHPDPTVEKNLEQLRDVVLSQGCDLGLAFDGDGDRIGVLDNQGRVLWGDQLLALLSRDVLAAQPGATIIADVKASQVLFDEVARLGGKPLMWKTGHSLIKTKMAELGAPLAGEMSGHIFMADKYYGFDDAQYVGVRILDWAARSGETLGAFRDSLPAVINTPELRFDCDEARKFVVVEEVRDRLQDAGADVDPIDGVRVKTDDGWWLLRASNTQAVLVARCESQTEDGLARLKAALSEQLSASGVALPDGF